MSRISTLEMRVAADEEKMKPKAPGSALLPDPTPNPNPNPNPNPICKPPRLLALLS